MITAINEWWQHKTGWLGPSEWQYLCKGLGLPNIFELNRKSKQGKLRSLLRCDKAAVNLYEPFSFG